MADVRIIHPNLGPEQIVTVAEESLPHHYRAGWRLLADDEAPQAAPVEGPPPMTRAQAKAARAAAAQESEE